MSRYLLNGIIGLAGGGICGAALFVIVFLIFYVFGYGLPIGYLGVIGIIAVILLAIVGLAIGLAVAAMRKKKLAA